jgi:hypothetical protein
MENQCASIKNCSVSSWNRLKNIRNIATNSRSTASEEGEMLMRCEAEQICDPEGYDIDIEADDIDVTDTVTVVWSIR